MAYSSYRWPLRRRAASRFGTWSRFRTARRRAVGNQRAARQQRDTATVTISRIATSNIVIQPGETSGARVINHWNELRQSEFFPNYAPMYDQMKIEKIRVKVVGLSSASAQTSNISPSVVLAFDRNGLNDGQQVTPGTISTYSSAQLKQWSSGNAFTMYQTIYPSTIMEKGQYIPTNSLENPDDVTDSFNPCVDTSDPTLPFKPLTLLGVTFSGLTPSAAQTIAFNVEYEYVVTFRGMRKPTLASSLTIYPLQESITENGQFTYYPSSYGADAFDPVNINVAVKQPAFTHLALSRSQDGTSYTYDGELPIANQQWTDTPGGRIGQPANTILIFVTNSSATILNNVIRGVVFFLSTTARNVTLPSAGKYVIYNATFYQNYYYMASVGYSNDPVVYSTWMPFTSSSLTLEIYVDSEDLNEP